jgi:hypothetical protein
MSNNGTNGAKLAEYLCHKKVRAGRIIKIDTSRPVPRIYFENAQCVDVADTWVKEKRAEVGGYYVVYDDGYASFSPAAAFEDGYTLIA